MLDFYFFDRENKYVKYNKQSDFLSPQCGDRLLLRRSCDFDAQEKLQAGGRVCKCLSYQNNMSGRWRGARARWMRQG